MTPPPHDETELLLAQARWVQALARRVVGDPALAEDLVQDTWVAALTRPAGRAPEVRSPRSWLARVLANRWGQERRDAARRRARERRSLEREGRPEVQPSAADTVERAELGRELADVVLGLDEPHRTTLLLRFYDDLGPREIAQRLGVPVKTVDTRLARGLELVRRSWDRRAGDDGVAWLPALALLAGPRPNPTLPVAAAAGSASLSLGVLLVNAKTLTVAAALVAGGLFLTWRGIGSEPSERLAAATVGAVELEREPARLDVPLEQGGSGRTELASPRPSVPTAASEPVIEPVREIVLLRGRVVDPEGRPLFGVRVGYSAHGEKTPELAVESRGDGRFELERSTAQPHVEVLQEGLGSPFAGSLWTEGREEVLLIAAPTRAIRARVEDGRGGPLRGARVVLELPSGFLGRFDALLHEARFLDHEGLSDAEGRFELEDVAFVPGSRLHAELGGFEDARVEVRENEAALTTLVLERPPGVESLAGRVVDREGEPVGGAHVSLGAQAVTTDSEGTFVLPVEEHRASYALVALRPGYLPARMTADAHPETGAPLFPDFVELVLGGEALSIRGVVVDEDGVPRDGVLLWLKDPEPFGVLRDDMLGHVETFLRPGAEDTDGYFHSFASGADGSFEVRGLQDRDYVLRFMDPSTYAILDAGPFEAGARDVEVVLPRDRGEPLEGRVLSRSGAPLVGQDVSLSGFQFGGCWTGSLSGVTDEEGRFRFERVGATRVLLSLRGDDVLPKVEAFDLEESGRDLELVLSVRCPLKIDLSHAPERADGFALLDAEGEHLDLHDVTFSSITRFRTGSLVDGRSKTLEVEETATTLVLLRDGEEVERVPVTLVPGRLNVIVP